MKNDYKNKCETWRRAIRLLEEHLTRADRAQKMKKVGD
jgi:Arc/MetJ-type ribon-helix-helix transcriptional regulator